MIVLYITTFDRENDKECDREFDTVIDDEIDRNVWPINMSGDRESDKGEWYVTNKVTNRWCGVWENITTRVIASSHFTTTKSIYNKSQKSASLW